MALAMYDKAYIFMDGALQGESSGGSIEYQGDPIPVQTFAKDLAGFTPVPKSATVNVESFVPIAGLAYNAIKKYLDNAFVTVKMQLGGSGQQMQADGMIAGPSISTSATDSTKFTFKVICEAKPFE